MSRSTLKIIGSQFFPPKYLTYAILGIPPLELLHQRIVIKFVLKCLHTQDDTTARILQIEQSPGHPFYKHIVQVKEFLKYKFDDLSLLHHRRLELASLSPDKFTYQKNEVLMFVCNVWNTDICSDLSTILIRDDFSIEHLDELHSRLSHYIRTENTVIHSPLFTRDEKRIDNTNISDFLHGRCNRFQNFVQSVLKVDKSRHFPFCLECCQLPDSPSHKLFECENIPDSSLRTEALMSIKDLGTNFHLEVLFGSPEVDLTDLLMTNTFEPEHISNNKPVRTDFKRIVQNICKYSMFDDSLLTRKVNSEIMTI